MNFVPFSPLNLATLTLINPDNCRLGVTAVQTLIYNASIMWSFVTKLDKKWFRVVFGWFELLTLSALVSSGNERRPWFPGYISLVTWDEEWHVF